MVVVRWLKKIARACESKGNPFGEAKVLGFIKERRVPTEIEFRVAVNFFKSAPEFKALVTSYILWSQDGWIKVENDVYGYEVTIRGGPLLDCYPAYYRLTREQSDELFAAILSCVPGSTFYADRFVPTKEVA